MLELNNAIHAIFHNFKSFLMANVEDGVSSPLMEKFAIMLPADNATLLSDQDNYKRISAFRLLSTHRLTDIKKNLLTIPSTVRETGTPKPKSQRGLRMKGKMWTKEKCPVCGKSFKPSVDELSGDYLDLKCTDHHTRPRYFYLDAREFKVNRIYTDKKGNKFDSFLMAHRQLEAMRRAADEHTFDPDEWSPKRLKEYNFKTLALKWIERFWDVCSFNGSWYYWWSLWHWGRFNNSPFLCCCI